MITVMNLQKALYKLGYLAGRNTIKKGAIPGELRQVPYIYTYIYMQYLCMYQIVFFPQLY